MQGESILISWMERGLLPDGLIRLGIRRLCKARLEELRAGGPKAQEAFIASLHETPVVALETDAANRQHYEVPAEFFVKALGPHRKYSSAIWEPGTETLEQAEAAMLALTCQRADLQDGQDILELGCGWGSLSLWMAEHYPNSRILGVSNSASQKKFIDGERVRRGLHNLEIVTADMNVFTTDRRFDRVVSVEMFEHMRNYTELLRRIATFGKADAKMFIHVFSHREYCYPFEDRGASDWMARHFFTGGLMPSASLLLNFQEHWKIQQQWDLSGVHYQKTSEAWLREMDRNRSEILDLFANVYGQENAHRWFVRWRVFFMACAELFGYDEGREWGVSHYLFQKGQGLDPVENKSITGIQ
ncbi:cyclopropane-fatty-acyl-phospholipid synthase [Bryobacterales bacterium F-183]|nr:cyclopropane-fatty-acyl-phospholipid synthase [Bryobacterales bacterium F-183]